MDQPPAPAAAASSADSVEARREARRRRILENSSNRLAKISGREEAPPPIVEQPQPTKPEVPEPSIVYPDPEMERDIYVARPQQQQQFVDPLQQLLSQMSGGMNGGAGGFAQFGQFSPAGGEDGAANPFAMFQGLADASALDAPLLTGDLFSALGQSASQQSNNSASAAAQPPVSLLVQLLRSKLHIAAIAVLTYLLAANDLMFRSHVFTLFLLWEFVELFLLKPYDKDRSSYLGIVFMVSGIPTEHSSVVMRWLSQTRRVLKDVAVFVFFFVVAHVLWQMAVAGEPLASVLKVGLDEVEVEAGERLLESVRRTAQQKLRQAVIVDDEVDEADLAFEF